MTTMQLINEGKMECVCYEYVNDEHAPQMPLENDYPMRWMWKNLY